MARRPFGEVSDYHSSIKSLFRGIEVVDGGDSVILDLNGDTHELYLDAFNRTLNNLNENFSSKSGSIYTSNTFEVLLKIETPRFVSPRMIIRQMEETIDRENGIKYELGPPSHEFFIFMLKKVPSDHDSFLRMSYYVREKVDEYLKQTNPTKRQFLDVGMNYVNHYLTLRITTSKGAKSSEFEDLANAFLYKMAYSIDLSVLMVQSLDEISPLRRRRRGRPTDMTAPQRTYPKDLVHHYLFALATDQPAFQFLSYYHVLEHHFVQVYQEEVVKKVRKRITSTSFSYKSDDEINKLVSLIAKMYRSRQSDGPMDEPRALELTLKKFVPMDDLQESVGTLDNSLLSHYKKEINFASAPPFEWDTSDKNKFYSQLGKRLYAMRNAIVHSKEADKPRYIPFKHEKELSKDIPLIRSIAEIVIESQSDIIE